MPLRLELFEQPLRVVLRLLHVRLIERVDAEERAGDGGGELPGEENLAEVERVFEHEIDDRMAGVGELASASRSSSESRMRTQTKSRSLP